MQIVTLYEYQTVNYKLSDFDFFENQMLNITERTLKLIDEINKSGQIFLVGHKTIKTLNYVGVIQVGNFSFQIFPKIFKNNEANFNKDIVAGNLLKMLSYSTNLPVKDFNIASLKSERIDLFEIIIHLFAKNLFHLLKSLQKKEYVKKSDDLRIIKGRIDFSYYNNPAAMHIIPCRYHEFSIDNIMNRTLKYTCYLLTKASSDFSNISTLRSIINILDPVDLVPVSIHDLDKIKFSRLNRSFEPYIRFCRIILSNSALTLQASEIEFFSLLIPMERLFEDFIAGVLKKNPEFFFNEKITIKSQSSIGKLAKDENGRGLFSLKPDILIGYPKIEAIIDTKYKMLDKSDRKMGVSQNDMYQMYAYATKSCTKKIMLLYPEVFVDQRKDLSMVVPDKEDVSLYIRAIQLSYDLNNEGDWVRFITDLKEIVAPLLCNEPKKLANENLI